LSTRLAAGASDASYTKVREDEVDAFRRFRMCSDSYGGSDSHIRRAKPGKGSVPKYEDAF
jgi:hypothetical protein